MDARADGANGVFDDFLQPAFAEHCVQCHGKDGKVKGKVNLLELKDGAALMTDVELLNDIVEVLEYEEMPPEDEPQPDTGTRGRMVNELKKMLSAAVEAEQAYPPTPIRRMNRFQYNNAVVDLFDLNCIVFTLPERMVREHRDYFQPETGKMADTVYVGSRPLGKSQMIEPRLAGVAAFPQDLRAEHGFDNRGDHLSLSPLLMETFLKLSQSITTSPDFGPKQVGIWNEFFAAPAPKAGGDLKLLARERLKPFLERAFRRPVDDAVFERYAGFVERHLDEDGDFTEAMRSVAAAVLASPKFLYLYDGAAERAAAESLDGFELASRLSFFLWGSIPDQELLDLAQAGELTEPEILDGQITRMLRDQKLKRFCDSFPTQWLQLDRIISSVPDPKKYPDFYFLKYRDSMHMMIEPLLLFETVLIENQPITQLIDSDFTYRSHVLRAAYGEKYEKAPPKREVRTSAVTMLGFDRLPVTDRRHGGVITNAAVMTMTSGPERTQPITRGAWLATVIFNDPPDPPPADVPPLGEKPADGEEHLTLRERLSKHRERADCKGCHEQIDPLGFALENYDPIGVWREKYENGRDIDMQGTLFRKHAFENVIDFKDAILAEKDRFTRGFTGHLLSFALARELGATDQRAVEQIAEATASDDYRIQTLIRQLIVSEPFQTKANPKHANPTALNRH